MSERPLVESGWQVKGVRDGERFFASLSTILPASACMVFEGTSIDRDLRDHLESVAVPARRRIRAGTIWPKPRVFHVPVSRDVLERIAEFAGGLAEPELCDHFHAYDDDRGLLQWYDAFDLPLFVDSSIGEPQLREMCEALGASYERWRAGQV